MTKTIPLLCIFGIHTDYNRVKNEEICQKCRHTKPVILRDADMVLRSHKDREWEVTKSTPSFLIGIIFGFGILFSISILQNFNWQNANPINLYVGIPSYLTAQVGFYLFITISMIYTLIFSVPKIRSHLGHPNKKLVIFVGGSNFGFGLFVIYNLAVNGMEKLF